MRLHVLGFPHTETTSEWSACAYTQRTMDFASFMTDRGYDVHLYAGECNQARVAEHIPIVTRAMQKAWYPDFDRTKVFNDFNPQTLPWRVFNSKAAEAICQRCSPGDLICVTMGLAHRPVAEAIEVARKDGNKTLEGVRYVETGIGYSGVWSPFRVYESTAWRHFLAAREPTDDLRWFDEVIPRGYFLDQFPFGPGGSDFLFLGRLTARKGPQIAADACKRLGVRLLVAGQGMKEHKKGEYILTDEGLRLEGDVHYLGVLSPAERAIILGSVRAVFMPTFYLEPGGGVAIEAQLCGTPVITTPYGAMTETVLSGKTGFHCSSMADFTTAAKKTEYLDRKAIRIRAEYRFSSQVVSAKYDRYFKKLETLSGEGWYAA